MFSRWISVVLAGFALSVGHSSALAQQESKSWVPNFLSRDKVESSSDSSSRNPQSASKDAGDSAWWLPWKSENKPKAKSTKPSGSMMGRMGRTTKKWWDNSVDFVNPFNDGPKPPKPNGYAPQNNTKKAGGGFFGWMKPEEDNEIRSVNDFLALPMPE